MKQYKKKDGKTSATEIKRFLSDYNFPDSVVARNRLKSASNYN